MYLQSKQSKSMNDSIPRPSCGEEQLDFALGIQVLVPMKEVLHQHHQANSELLDHWN
jgi:hypothetical protein